MLLLAPSAPVRFTDEIFQDEAAWGDLASNPPSSIKAINVTPKRAAFRVLPLFIADFLSPSQQPQRRCQSVFSKTISKQEPSSILCPNDNRFASANPPGYANNR